MNTLAPSFLIGSSSFLQVTRTYMKAWMSSNFNHIPPPTPELVICPLASKILIYKVVTNLAPSFLIGYSSYLQVTRKSITS